MRAFNLGAVRRALYASAVLTLLSVPSLAQVVERGRTFADLTASHPCDTGLTDRIARVTDCDGAATLGDGGGAYQCWAYCDGTAPWADVAIGASGEPGPPGPGSNSFETIDLPSGTDLVATSGTDTLTVTCAAPLVCTGTAGTDTWAMTFDGTGNIATATALAANGANCSAGNYPLGVNASGAAESCTAALSSSGNIATATALAANGANCSAGSYPLGVDASGAVEDCTVAGGGSEASALAPSVVIEGTTADAFEGNFTFADPTADWTWNWLAAGAMRGPDGTTALPAYGFASDPNTGLYLAGADTLSLTAGGVDSLYVLGNLLSSNVNISSWEAIGIGAAKKLSWSDVANPANDTSTGLIRSAAGVVGVTDALHLTPIASPPRTCDATAEGDLYSDTSHALCWCDASAWQKLSGAGTCA